MSELISEQQQQEMIMSLPDYVCAECGAIYWEDAIKMKIVPSFMTADGNPQIAHIPAIICKSCKLEMTESLLRDKEAQETAIIT